MSSPRATLSATPSVDEENKVVSSPAMRQLAHDGGLAAWTVVLGTWRTSFCSFGWLNITLPAGGRYRFAPVGVAAIFQPAVTSVAGWFDGRRSLAFGIAFTRSSLGGVLLPTMVTRLMARVGFGWSMRISAFVNLFLLLIANISVRPYAAPPQHDVQPLPTAPKRRNPLTEPSCVLLMARFFLFSYGCFIISLPVHAPAAGMDANLAACMLPIMNVGSLFGRLFTGWSGDKTGQFNVFIAV
ncbi:hypothetical protein SPBR_03175 [Sporothrix brasiliensis 5110]|uniref:Major facilitator superfamily (MFS) profile domain-containing protein n=1 Tax=Sporothrix brasiliensis 5110 TaxID=1398154 RepID=A0A0C2J196_9PEZI|nr:uncharacterized protein SPBR_03175 [Sporothrix brasiliensis 5110]KIH92785.1 hypothetical protein SPBR_03175 [Sporothrix brasiliensis 5110]